MLFNVLMYMCLLQVKIEIRVIFYLIQPTIMDKSVGTVIQFERFSIHTKL